MSLLGADFDSFFGDAIDALRPYLDDIVCVGGCANALYRFHELASNVMWGYLGTKDVDAGVPQKLPLHGRPPVSELMDRIGFKELTVGSADEAVIKYGPKNGEARRTLSFFATFQGFRWRIRRVLRLKSKKASTRNPCVTWPCPFRRTGTLTSGALQASSVSRVR